MPDEKNSQGTTSCQASYQNTVNAADSAPAAKTSATKAGTTAKPAPRTAAKKTDAPPKPSFSKLIPVAQSAVDACANAEGWANILSVAKKIKQLEPAFDPKHYGHDTAKAVLKPEGKTKLDDLVGKLKGVNLEVIIAVGHTDSQGGEAYNQKLSVKRAEAVKTYLVEKGIEPNRVYTEGKGKTQPVADNKTAEGRSKNRRVEIEVVGTRTVTQ